MKNLTEKQKSKFALATFRLAHGYTYRLHSETGNLGESGPVWGVTVELNGESVGHVQRPQRDGFVSALTTCEPQNVKLMRLFLNRAAAALWHRQPNWSSAS